MMSYTDGWSQELLEERAEKIREYLAENDLEALAVTSKPNFDYVTGFFVGTSFWERPVVAVIPLDYEPFMVLNELSTNHVEFSRNKGRGWIDDVKIYTEHPRQTNRLYTVTNWSTLVSKTFRERGITKGKIGVDSNQSFLKKKLKDDLPDLSFVDAGRLLREMRLVKTDAALDLIRKAGELSDWGQEKLKELIAEGKTPIGIGTETAHLLAKEATDRYPEYQIYTSAGFTGTGPHAAMPHGVGGYTGRKLKEGDTLVNGVGVSLNQYGVENERTFILGKPTERQKKVFNVMKEAQENAVEMCVAGNKVSDIDSAAQKVIENAGYGDYIMHRTGHGMGLRGHEYWDDIAFNHRKLEAGMVTSVEPGIYIKGFGGFRFSDTVIIGKEEPEVVTEYSKDLNDLTVK